jgi:hypothetical protein
MLRSLLSILRCGSYRYCWEKPGRCVLESHFQSERCSRTHDRDAVFLAALGLQVDFIWSSWPPVHAALLVATSATQHAVNRTATTSRNVALVVIVTVWGVRLTGNFVRRGGIGHVRLVPCPLQLRVRQCARTSD